MKHLLPLIFAILAATALHAQEGAGRSFILAFPDTTTNTTDFRFPNKRFVDRAMIFIYSAVDNRVRIRGNGYDKVETIRQGGFAIVDLLDSALPAPDPFVTASNRVVGNTFRLEAEAPVIVYCYLLTTFGTEAWTPLPVESWGTEYFVAARPGEIANDVSTGGPFDFNRKSKMASAEITIIAAHGETHITIRSNADLHEAPRVVSIVLDAGEVYQLQSDVDTSVFADLQPDIGGSRITASRPIGVISGNTRSQVLYFQEGLGQNIFKNMLIEWLSPVEMHGTEFVYMPTWDLRRPTGAPGEDLSSKRKGEYVRLYATTPGLTQGYSLDNNIGRTSFTIARAGAIREEFIGTPEARYYATDYPAQAMMTSTAVVRYEGHTRDTAGYYGAEFDGWGAFMAELVPRHRWSSFAPFYAPSMPDSMEHFINVVTDSVHACDIFMENGARFEFNRGVIERSGLIWGTMEVTPGRGHFLEGRNGARFSGHLYGLARGREEYRVGTDTSEYEEYLAVAYGYPLSANHLDATSSGWFDIYLLPSCGSTAITIARKPSVPAGIGIGSISLEWGNNARIESIKPLPLNDAATATVVMAPIRADRDASALLSIEDTAGNITRHRYTYFAEQLDVTVKGQRYETISNLDAIPGVRYTWPVVLTNPLDRAIEVADIKLERGGQEFSITSVGPRRPPFDLAAGDSITVTIEARPAGNHRGFIDTLSIVCGCQTTKMPLAITTSDPEIMVDDLDFGTFVGLGANSSETMWIRNMGTGTLLFTEGPGGDLISWLHREHFIVAPIDLQRLRTARLGSGDSMALAVRFHGVTEGVFTDTARFFSNDGERKGYAIWRANVRRISGVDEPDASNAGVTIRPNPVTGAATITFLMEHPGDATLSITDAAGREVLSRDLGDLPAGEQRIEWNASSVASGVYLYTLRSGDRVVSGTVVVVR